MLVPLTRGGYISGDCSAGFFCLAGSDQYTPINGSAHVTNVGNWTCDPDLPCAGPCPAGKYCPEGTADPLPCPEHTLNTDLGARMLNDCLPCPAGHWCLEGWYFLRHILRCASYQRISNLPGAFFCFTRLFFLVSSSQGNRKPG